MHLLQDRPKARRADGPPPFVPSVIASVDAAFAFVADAPRLSSDFVESLLLAIGLRAASADAASEVAALIRDALVSLRDRTSVPKRELEDRLLDVRLAARRAELAGVLQ